MEVVFRTLDPFVTSAFQRHSLTAAMGIISSIVGGLSKLAIAKIMDTIGRPQGLVIALLFWVMGMVMMAACKNVETYAAAQVFASTGYVQANQPVLQASPFIDLRGCVGTLTILN